MEYINRNSGKVSTKSLKSLRVTAKKTLCEIEIYSQKCKILEDKSVNKLIQPKKTILAKSQLYS